MASAPYPCMTPAAGIAVSTPGLPPGSGPAAGLGLVPGKMQNAPQDGWLAASAANASGTSSQNVPSFRASWQSHLASFDTVSAQGETADSHLTSLAGAQQALSGRESGQKPQMDPFVSAKPSGGPAPQLNPTNAQPAAAASQLSLSYNYSLLASTGSASAPGFSGTVKSGPQEGSELTGIAAAKSLPKSGQTQILKEASPAKSDKKAKSDAEAMAIVPSPAMQPMQTGIPPIPVAALNQQAAAATNLSIVTAESLTSSDLTSSAQFNNAPNQPAHGSIAALLPGNPIAQPDYEGPQVGQALEKGGSVARLDLPAGTATPTNPSPASAIAARSDEPALAPQQPVTDSIHPIAGQPIQQSAQPSVEQSGQHYGGTTAHISGHPPAAASVAPMAINGEGHPPPTNSAAGSVAQPSGQQPYGSSVSQDVASAGSHQNGLSPIAVSSPAALPTTPMSLASSTQDGVASALDADSSIPSPAISAPADTPQLEAGARTTAAAQQRAARSAGKLEPGQTGGSALFGQTAPASLAQVVAHTAGAQPGAGLAPSTGQPSSGAASGNGQSTTSQTFAALDAETSTGAPVWTHAGPQHAEAGFQDPTLGWVGVRADQNGAGIHAALVPGSTDAAAELGGHLSGLNSYLAEHHTPVATLTLASSGSGSGAPGTMNQGAGNNGHGGAQQGAGQQPNQDSMQASGQGSLNGQRISDSLSTGLSANRGNSELSPVTIVGGAAETAASTGGVHISVMA